jgi:hypothetical protein
LPLGHDGEHCARVSAVLDDAELAEALDLVERRSRTAVRAVVVVRARSWWTCS